MSNLPPITETLTAQLLNELAVKNRLPTGELLRDIQEFDQLLREVTTMPDADEEATCLTLASDKPTDVRTASEELKSLFGHDYDLLTRAAVDEWLAERRVFAKGWQDLYGPRLYQIYYSDGRETQFRAVSEAFYHLLAGAHYDDVPADFLPPIIATAAGHPDYASLIRQADDNLALRILVWMKSEGLFDKSSTPEPTRAPEDSNDINRLLRILDEIYAPFEPGGIQVLAEERTQGGSSNVGKSKAPRNDFEVTRWNNKDKSLGPADYYVSLRVRVRKRTRTYLYRFLAGFSGTRLVSFEAHDADFKKRYDYRDFSHALYNLGFAEPLAKKRYKEQFRPKRKAI